MTVIDTVRDYLFSQINMINYNLIPLFFLSSCCGCIVSYLSLCHCSLNTR